MNISAKDLAKLLNGTVVGDSEVEVSAPAKIEEGNQGTVTFLGNLKYEKYLYSTNASIVIVNNNFQPSKPISSTLIKVENVYQSVAFLMKTFETSSELERKISTKADIHDEAKLSQQIAIGAFSQVNRGASIGQGSQIFSQVYIGENVSIGSNCIIHPGVKIYHNSVIGNNCIIHANVVIGSDGFGYSPNESGEYEKIPQIGNVLIEDNVEIGANTVIDKATMGSTIIKKGSKLDNLIQIAHNVQIGENSVIAAQAGIAGSTKIGDRVMIGGQVGIVGHIEIADEVKIQAQSGVTTTVKEIGFKLYGSPALEYRTYLKAYSIFRKLPEIINRIQKLESE